jgi:type I restriction enzyme S subunit
MVRGAVMIADLKPYPEYKESGLPWLGQVPGHWPVFPNRALFVEVKDRNHPDEEMLSVTITRGIIRQKALLDNSSKKDSSRLDKSAYKLVQPRDIAYNKMRAWQGAIGASEFRGIISPAYVVMRLRQDKDLPSYFHHLYRTPQFAKEAERWSYGITSDMWSLRPEHFKMIYTPEPPPSEQAAIVKFLNWSNSRLDQAIKAKRKVIALLTEQKQAIIHRAVTKGLGHSVTMKDSGVSWIGDIPVTFKRTRLGRVCLTIRDGTHNPPPAVPGIHRLLSVRNIIKSEFVTRPDDRTMTLSSFNDLQRSYKVQEGDIVIAIVGGTTGKSAIVRKTENVTVQRSLGILHPNLTLVKSEFLQLIMSGQLIQNQIHQIMGKYAAQPGIYLNELGSIQIILPTIDDQEVIIAVVQKETLPITAAISRLDREILLLREYLTRLVADVVTGKLDVREAAAQLPDETIPEIAEEPADLSEDTEPVDEEIAV